MTDTDDTELLDLLDSTTDDFDFLAYTAEHIPPTAPPTARHPASDGSTFSQRITIRINTMTLERVKRMAAATGTPYQTLINTLVAEALNAREARA